MQLEFSLGNIHFLEADKEWWRDSTNLARVFQAVVDAGLWKDLNLWIDDDDEVHELDSVEMLLEQSTTWDPHFMGGIVSSTARRPDRRLGMYCLPSEFTFTIALNNDSGQTYGGELFEQLLTFIRGLYDSFQGNIAIGPRFSVRLASPKYPRLRPCPENGFFPFGTVLNGISGKWRERNSGFDNGEIDKVLAADLPPGTQRIEYGDLILICWTDQLDDEQQLVQRCSVQEEFVVKTTNRGIDSSYNEAGDWIVMWMYEMEKDEFVTFYDPNGNSGYKAVVVYPDGSVNEELFSEMQSWISTQQLPNGKSLDDLSLILPTRESCLQIVDRASSIGIFEIYYTNDDGQLFNPFPLGLWRDNGGVLYVGNDRRIWREYPPPN